MSNNAMMDVLFAKRPFFDAGMDVLHAFCETSGNN